MSVGNVWGPELLARLVDRNADVSMQTRLRDDAIEIFIRVPLSSEELGGSQWRNVCSTIGLKKNANERRYYHRGVPLPLSPREYTVFDLLLEKVGTIVSKQNLLLAGWGPSYEAAFDLLYNLISRLRQHLGRELGKLLESLGGGYCFGRALIGA